MTRLEGIRERLSEDPVVRVETAHGPYVVRLVGGRPVVHHALCPHRGGPLEDAYQVGGLLICAWHRSTFRARDGRTVHGPACSGLPVVPARFDGPDLVVDWPEEPSDATGA
ncbi:Rieske (2Fe-2S) protein [Actinomadura rubrisoli]|uniref:Rieske (2Fe-2S) protein n=1 Tax=Actinomadura rubrisoli TaxID=2530368 RepID=A0A4R5ANX4_9ACTN|nr:Rieske (2Fe-2S) protein [Actinomadura rubrisoli]TDD73349.1 Rieske (2Fe-2S) protein [Actinomadura rubrisoli]